MRLLPLFFLISGSLAAQTADTAYFQATMSPSNEVPAIPGFAASGLGTVVAHVLRDSTGTIVSGSVDFWVDYTYPQALTATGLHIHKGAAGVNGAIIINAITGAAPYMDPKGIGRVERQGIVAATDTAGVAALQGLFADPTQYYINMHSTEYPGGFMRAQLNRAAVSHLMGLMSATNEVPALTTGNTATASVTTIAVQDATGNFTSGSVIFDVNYILSGPVTFTGLHIHKGLPGTNGAIEIPTTLAATPSDPTGRGNLHFPVNVNVSSALVQDGLTGIFTNPAGYYINFHTTDNPGGSARSVLLPTDEIVVPVSMSPANEVPAITGYAATGIGRVTINTTRASDGTVAAGVVTFDVNYQLPAGVTTVNGFHIHDGVAGVNGPVIINTGISGATPALTDASGQGDMFRTVTVGDAAGLSTLNSLVSTPEKQYINMHSSVYGGGFMRAQMGTALAAAPSVAAVLTAVSDPKVTSIAPGELISIYGSNLARNSSGMQGFAVPTFPVTFNGVSAMVGGVSAPLLYVSPGQVNAQVPFETATGMMAVTVKSGGTVSNTFQVPVVASAPSIFFDSVGGIALHNSTYALVRPANPAKAGEVLLVYGTGLGQTAPALSTGQVVSGSGNNVAGVTITIGGKTQPVVYAIASPMFIGLYQVAITVSADAPSGSQPMKMTIAGVDSNTVTLPIQ